MYPVERIVNESTLRDAHPFEKGAFAFSSLLVALAAPGIAVPALVFPVMLLVTVVRARVSLSRLCRFLAVPLLFILASVPLVFISIRGVPFDALLLVKAGPWYWGMDAASIREGALVLARSLASLGCLSFFVCTTPPSDIEYLLRALRVPAILRELFVLTYRSIAFTIDRGENILVSQRARMGYVSFGRGLRSLGGLLSSVLLLSLVRGRRSHEALLARGYRGTLEVATPRRSFSPGNWAGIVLIESLFCTIALWGRL